MISFPHSVSAGSTANLATARVPPPGNLDWNVDRLPEIRLPWGRIRKVASKENLRDEQLRRN
jgi:hypothetical protein